MHALRHFYASTLLDAGESIKALASYRGHADPGFTLRTYTHLMPSSEERTRKAIDQAFGYRSASRPDDGLGPLAHKKPQRSGMIEPVGPVPAAHPPFRRRIRQRVGSGSGVLRRRRRIRQRRRIS
jgi:hypothetical protein